MSTQHGIVEKMQSPVKLKAALREEVWRNLDARRVATPRPCRGKIPIFAGSRVATMRVLKKSFFIEADTVYSTLDASLQPMREEVLRHRKKLIVMQPGFRGFLVIDGRTLPKEKIREAATPRGLSLYAERVGVLEGVEIDVVSLGSVAVDKQGGRLGRGDGQHDLEYAVLRELGVIKDKTLVLTVVHDLQVVEKVPMELHDVPVDYIATPSALHTIEKGYRKPNGVIWDIVDSAMVDRLPLLKLLAGLG